MPSLSKDINTSVALSGPLGETKTEYAGSIGTIEALGATVRRTNFNATGNEGIFTLTASQSAEKKNGTIALRATIDTNKNESQITSSEFAVTNYPAISLYQETYTAEEADKLLVDVNGSIIGPFDTALIAVEAKGSMKSSVLPFTSATSVALKIKGGELSLISDDAAKVIQGTLTLGLTSEKKEGKLKASFNGKDLPALASLGCSRAIADLNYTYPRADFFSGNGNVIVSTFSAGCKDIVVSLSASPTSPVVIPISNGKISVFQGRASYF